MKNTLLRSLPVCRRIVDGIYVIKNSLFVYQRILATKYVNELDFVEGFVSRFLDAALDYSAFSN